MKDLKKPVPPEGGENKIEDIEDIVEEIEVEDLAIDGICGVY
jgi:mycofactocin precursor